MAATITPQHLLFNRNVIFERGLRPHRVGLRRWQRVARPTRSSRCPASPQPIFPHLQYCLPVLKTEDDRRALLDAVRHNTGKFFMGTDSAPHPRYRKECECCSAGCFTMHAPLELYAMAFEEAGCVEKLDVRM